MRSRLPILLLASLTATFIFGVTASASNDSYWGQQWGMHRIKAEQAWSIGTGSGVIIAVVDTGMAYNHQDLAGKRVGGWDFVRNDSDPIDETAGPAGDCPGNDGHGTHVSGIAGAITNNGIGVAGAAPNARIMPVRVLSERGCGSFEAIEAGVRWAASNGAHVINLSLSEGAIDGNVFGRGLTDSVNYAWSRGVIPVVSAGNDSFPSGYRGVNAIVVGATNQNDQRDLRYSNLSEDAKWGMWAPGTEIWSSIPSGYASWSGTSMAAPHVAGAAAVLRGRGLTPQQTVDRLLATADPIGIPIGHGRLNLAKAVAGLTPEGAGGGEGSGQPPATGGSSGGSSGSQGSSGGGGSRSGGGGAAPAQASPPTGNGMSPTTKATAAPETTSGTLGAEDEKKRPNTALNLILLGILVLGGAGALAWMRFRSWRKGSET